MQDTNQVKRAIELDTDSGKFEYDESGYLRFTPSADEEKAINSWLDEEIAAAKELHRPIFDEARENIEAYKAIKTKLAGGDEAIVPSPICRAPADQIISSTVNMIMRSRVIVSVDPYFPGTYPVIAPLKQPSQEMMDMGLMPGTPVRVEADAETIAQRFEQGLDFKNREKLGFEKFIHEIVHDCVTGAPFAWAKVCREKKRRPLIAPKVKGAIVDLSDKEESYVDDGDDVHYYRVSGFNMLRPNLDDEVDDLPWIAERTPKCPEDITAGFLSKDYFLIKDTEDADELAKNCGETRDSAKIDVDASTRNITGEAKPKCDVYDVSFYRVLRGTDPETGGRKVKKYLLCGEFHAGARRLLNCYRHPYDHMRRIYVPVSQFLDGSSTVSIIKYNQHVGTHIIQSEIKNAYHANNFTYWYDPNDPDIAKFFKNRVKLNPGDVIPGKEGESWGVVRAGAQHYSLLGLAQWNAGTAQEASNVSDYESGRTIPGRTPSSTVAQILEQGGQQQILFLRMLNRFVAKVMRLYLETKRQFAPLGEELPIRDENTKQLILVPMRFPVGDVLDNFRISLTAADEALAKERDPEGQALMLDLYQRHTSFVAGVVGPMLNPELTSAQREFYRKTLEGEQVLFNKIISSQRTDEEKFDLQSAINAMTEEANAVAEQMQMQQQMGGMGAGSAAMGPAAGAEGQMPNGGPPGSGAEPVMGGGPPPAA